MKKKRPVVLVFNDYYLPGFKGGGPIRSISNMVDRLSDKFDFRIATRDRDLGDISPYPDIEAGQWNVVGSARVLYLGTGKRTFRALGDVIREITPDAILLNSFFDPTFTQKVLWLRRLGLIPRIPMIVAPRGEFSLGALQLKRVKKQSYIAVSSAFGLYRHLAWKASSSYELADIVRRLKFVSADDVWVAADIAPIRVQNRPKVRVVDQDALLRICFLSRISPMKNLEFALRVLAAVKTTVRFSIYGPVSDTAYWNCQSKFELLPSNIEVRYMGQVDPHEVISELATHDVFFLPTRGENYGHVIHEALTAGLPVLISDRTPWEDLKERCVGWSFPLESIQPFVETIEMLGTWSARERSEASNRAIQYALEMTDNPVTISDNCRLFRAVVQQRSSALTCGSS